MPTAKDWSTSSRASRPHPSWRLQGTAVASGFHYETRRKAASAGHSRAGRQIVQRALVEVLNAIWEQDFPGFSYEFRPGRGQHDALDALAAGITRCKVNRVLDADIAGFFDTVSHDWLIRFVEHR